MLDTTHYTEDADTLTIKGDDLMALRAESMKPIPWLFSDLIVEGDQVMIAGASKAGKTWLALQMAVAAASGGEFLRWSAVRPLRTCYINLEVGRHMWSKRVMLQVQEASENCNGTFVSVSSLRTIDVMNPRHLQQMQNYIKDEKFEFVVIDVLQRCHTADENDNGAMKQVLYALRAMCCGAASVVVHHARKPPAGLEHASLGPSAIRGASSIVGEVDMALIFTVRAGQGARYSLEMVARNVETPDELLLDRSDDMRYYEHEGQENNLDEIIQTLFKGGHSLPRKDVQQAVAEGMGVAFETARKAIKGAVERGLIAESRQGRQYFYYVPVESPVLRAVPNAYLAASHGDD